MPHWYLAHISFLPPPSLFFLLPLVSRSFSFSLFYLFLLPRLTPPSNSPTKIQKYKNTNTNTTHNIIQYNNNTINTQYNQYTIQSIQHTIQHTIQHHTIHNTIRYNKQKHNSMSVRKRKRKQSEMFGNWTITAPVHRLDM